MAIMAIAVGPVTLPKALKSIGINIIVFLRLLPDSQTNQPSINLI